MEVANVFWLPVLLCVHTVLKDSVSGHLLSLVSLQAVKHMIFTLSLLFTDITVNYKPCSVGTQVWWGCMWHKGSEFYSRCSRKPSVSRSFF